jgi:hypothetical protein
VCVRMAADTNSDHHGACLSQHGRLRDRLRSAKRERDFFLVLVVALRPQTRSILLLGAASHIILTTANHLIEE